MQQEGIDRLQPDQWLNDCVIDLDAVDNKEGAKRGKLDTHLQHTVLHYHGIDLVLNWTLERNVDVFLKTCLFYLLISSCIGICVELVIL
jgi:hypothetical protein